MTRLRALALPLSGAALLLPAAPLGRGDVAWSLVSIGVHGLAMARRVR